MFSIELSKKRLGFNAAHFLVSHEKCSRLHGHNYKVRIGARGEKDTMGMVADFGDLTKKGADLCKKMDQRVIVPGRSGDVRVTELQDQVRVELPDREYVLPREDIVVLPITASTAEALAEYIFVSLAQSVPRLEYVEVEESPGSVARYQPGSP